MKTITITAELTDDEAMAYAQFVKRTSFSDYRAHAISEDEAYVMLSAENKIRAALADQGYAPR